MSYRRRKREIERNANKQLDKIELKKRGLNKKAGEDLFERIHEMSKFGPIKIYKTGIKAAPIVSYSLWGASLSVRNVYIDGKQFESLALSVWKFRFMVKNWTVRKNKKPKGAVSSYIFELRKISG